MHVRVRMFDRCEPPLDLIYQQHSRGYRHDYEAGFHLLDVDVSGLFGRSSCGYFATGRGETGTDDDPRGCRFRNPG